MDLSGCRLYRGPAWNWLFASRRFVQRCSRGRSRFFHEFSHSSFPRARRRRSHLSLGGGLDAKYSFHHDRSLSALSSGFQPRSPQLSSFRGASYSWAMTPLPNEWAVKRRADACAVTRRPFVTGEYFYTLLYHDAGGYRREDLSEEAWLNRNENIRPFSFWKSRYKPLTPKAAEPVPKENAEQLFRRLMASDSPNANACYVLAAMLERKRILKQVKTESRDGGSRVLIYEQGSTGDVFIVPDPQLRLDELEHMQNEVAELLSGAM